MPTAAELGMTQEQLDYLIGQARLVQQDLATTGTVNNSTPNTNLAAVANQAGNTSGAVATPYITSNGTTDYHITGGSYVPPTDGGSSGSGGNPPPVVDTTNKGGSSGTQTTNSGGINAQEYINQLNELRKNATISALGKSHDAALSNLGNEKSAIQPKYYDQRNQVAAGAQQQARNFAEFMANRGGSSSGVNAQATLSNNMTTQGNLGTLGRQEAQAYTDIERRTSDLNNAYQSDVASATANAEADKMQALLTDYYAAQQRGDTLAQNQIQNAIAQSQLAMQQQGQQFTQNLATTQQKQNEANTKFAQEMQIDAVTYQKARDAIADKNYQATFEQNIKQQGFENALKIAVQQHQISNDAAQIAISQQNATTASNNSTNTQNNTNQDNLMNVWKATGKAPAGIPNVTEGTPYAGQTSATDVKQNTQSQYVTGFDSLTPEKRKLAFTNEKASIIDDLGIAGYNALYSMYFDANGDPK